MLGKAVRERGCCPSRRRSTCSPTCPRGCTACRDAAGCAEGWHADVVVLDPDDDRPQEVRMRFDLPTGAPRLYGGADGIDHVLVNGNEIVDHGEFTDARPGTLLRSGRDTETVTAS